MLFSLKGEKIASDAILKENAQKVLTVIEEFKEAEIDAPMIQQILKIQNLVEELAS
mgnify:CR=1 FL=1